MLPIIQLFSAFTHPTNLPGWISRHQGMIGNIFGYDGACADKCILSNSMAADDGAVGSQSGSFLYQGGTNLIHFGNFGPGIVDICEDHGGPAENAIFQSDPLVNGDIVLYLAPVADRHIGPDDNILSDVAVLTDFRSG
jgi:hypothetical protein